MRIVNQTGSDDVAIAYLAEMPDGRAIEFVESVEPPHPRERKWVLIVSSLYGCPIGCPICDAGGHYRGRLGAKEILDQIDFLVDRRFPARRVPVEKFKVQFARMGEPALNPAVLEVLEELPRRYDAPGLLPALSSIAPAGSGDFFERLLDIKERLYPGGRFQLQFSIHTTDLEARERMIPARKWDFARIAAYGRRFHRPGERKVTLNFALGRDLAVDPGVLRAHFDPRDCLVKITPVNPTHEAARHAIASRYTREADAGGDSLVAQLRAAGYEVIVSIGELEENRIGSNCGQLVRRHLAERDDLPQGYTRVRREGVTPPAR